MHRHPVLSGTESANPQPSTSSVIQALAGLAQVALAVAAYLQLNTPRAWLLLGLGAALLALTFGGPLMRRIGVWWRERHDDRTARVALPALRSLARSFAKLVSADGSDTLPSALQEAFKGYHGMLDRLHVPPMHLFGEMLHNLGTRLEEEPADKAHVLRALNEFYTAVSAHSAQCIDPLFRSMPKDARDLLTPAALARLNSYRERYLDFHARFTSFTEDFGASLRASKLHQAYYLFRPDALTA